MTSTFAIFESIISNPDLTCDFYIIRLFLQITHTNA